MSNQKKQSFLGGAAILAAAVVVVKFIGFFYKVPLNNILGGPGKTYFDTAYKIYNFLLTFSTAGLPLAISNLQGEMSSDFGLIMAGAALAAVPIIIVFIAFQKYFTQGIAMGAVKG